MDSTESDDDLEIADVVKRELGIDESEFVSLVGFLYD